MFPQIVDQSFENKVLDISHDEYHKRNDCVHSSSIKNILKSPHAYKFLLEHKQPETKALKFGTLAHGVILEGSQFLNSYVVQPVFKGFTKDGKETTSMAATSVKEQYNDWLKNLPTGTQIMTQEEHDKMRWMLDSMLNHKFVMEVLKDGISEHKKQWRDPVTGLACISSDDFVSFKNDLWVDIKTTPDSSWPAFRKSVEKYNYPLQAAFYARGLKEVHGKDLHDKVWIAVESQPPYECRVHFVSPYYMEVGEMQVRKGLRELKYAIENNKWEQGQTVIEAGEPSGFYKGEFDLQLQEEGI